MIRHALRPVGKYRQLLRAAVVPVVFDKLINRLTEPGENARQGTVQRCLKEAQSWQQFVQGRDNALWEEISDYVGQFGPRAEELLRNLGVRLGGGGNYALCYFLARLLKPTVVVETGVAAGFTSRAILMALKKNQVGRLYSSDLPYLRIAEAERYVGLLVEDELKDRWDLAIEGDVRNLKTIAKKINHIDLLHYDSDKTYRGRARAIRILEPLFRPTTVILMDDVQDNPFFFDFVSKRNLRYRLFESGGKFMGLVGL